MQLFFLAVYLFEALIAFVYFFDNFKLKRSLPATFAILTVLYLAAFAVNILDNNINIINDVAFFSVNMIFGMLCFEISLKSCIFHSSFLLAVMFLTELVAEAGISALLKIPIDAYKTNSCGAVYNRHNKQNFIFDSLQNRFLTFFIQKDFGKRAQAAGNPVFISYNSNDNANIISLRLHKI